MARLTEEEIVQILTYFVEDTDFQNPELLSIVGKASGTAPDLDKLDPNPVSSGLPFPALQTQDILNPNPPPDYVQVPLSQDWLVRAFPFNGRVRVLLANTKTYPDHPALDETRYGLAEVPRSAYAFFFALARKILFTVCADAMDGVATNPHEILLVKRRLAIANFEDDDIYFLKPNELNGLPEGTDYVIDNEAFFDVQMAIVAADPNPEHALTDNAHGQTMFMATNGTDTFIYIVYIVYTLDPVTKEPDAYEENRVVKLRVLDELSENGYPQLEYVEQATTGLNTVGRALSTDENGVPILVMPAIGGIQQNGATNDTLSGIHSLPAFETWTTDPDDIPEAKILLRGDPQPSEEQPLILSHDIYVAATAYRGSPTDKLHILALMHHGVAPAIYALVDYEIYETTAAELAAMGALTISQAVAAGKLRLIDSGKNDTRGPLWDMATAMGTSPSGDRRITLKGGAVEFAAVQGYNSGDLASFVTYERGYGAGKIGGMNVNSFTLTSQAIKDAERGLQFKHTLSGILPEALRAAAKAEKAAKAGLRALPKAATPAVEPEEDDGEDKK
jgi:hypothetical protein